MKSKDHRRALEHQVLRTLKALGVQNKRILLGVSGGVDSMVLLELMRLWQPLLGYELSVAYVHHGRAIRSQLAYRNRAQALVREICEEAKIAFFSNEKSTWPETILRSEAELREFRWQLLTGWQKASQSELVAVAHHLDDMLETRLLRLIRGTSEIGLTAMTQQDGDKIRPLLGLTRKQIAIYARGKLRWAEDPSNQRTDSLRNWLRLHWLPQLEEHSPGASKSLARSLQLIAESAQNQRKKTVFPVWAKGGVLRKPLLLMTKKQQSQVVVEYLRQLGLKHFQQSHVNEIVRRLDTRRKSSQFSLLGLSWTLYPDLILASRV